MICKHCETDNPEKSVFCMHCGKRMDGKKICPSCGASCPEEAIFCNACGKQIVKEGSEEREAQPTEAPEGKKSAFEKVRSAFDISGGICLMVAVLFSFAFVFCMGLTLTATAVMTEIPVELSKISMWDFFGSKYDELKELLDYLTYYSGYFETANYIPAILTTVICAGTLVSVLICTVIAAVQYGRHFKNPQVNYATPAITAVLSFILGAVAFLSVNATSIGDYTVNISAAFDEATLAGIILGAIFLGLYCVSRVVILGREFITKRAIINFVCTLAGILFVILVVVFAASPAVILKGHEQSKPVKTVLSYSTSNLFIAGMFANSEKAPIPENFAETFITSAIAQFVQIALLILVFVLLIRRAGGFGKDSKSCLGITIATVALAAVYLILSCVAISFCSDLINKYDHNGVKVVIGAGPIVAFIASAFALADAITHKLLLKKTV